MHMKTLIVIFLTVISYSASAQFAEVYTGDKRAGVDIMWTKPIKNKDEATTPWLYFSRNRASVDYDNQPLFLSVNAVSYNFKSGIGLVGVSVFGATGFVEKLGAQFVKRKNDFFMFGWVVAEAKQKGNVDLFGMFRFTPKISETFHLFTQLELSNAFPTVTENNFSLIQRMRLGLKYSKWQFGGMLDLTELGRESYTTTHNTGVFLRHEF